MDIRKTAIYSLLSFFLITAIFCAFNISNESAHVLVLKEDVAEINRVKYGILSVNEWKEQLAIILSKKIQEFEVTDNNRAEMQATVEKALHTLLNEVKLALDRKKKEGNFWDKLKGETVGIFFDIDEFKKDIPRFATAILEEFERPEARKGITDYIKKKLDEFVDKTIGHEDRSYRDTLIDRYGSETPKEASDKINLLISGYNMSLWMLASIMIVCVIMGFLIWWLSEWRSSTMFIMLSMLCIIPLISGVTTPMIDIDARIDSFSFELMGEPLSFNNQVLYYQSKSIMDVVKILVSKGKLDTIVVGILIMLFSVIFPFIKMSLIAICEFKRAFLSRPIVQFFVFHSSKWSMADVLVVAIFMSYIGFKGVIESQLGQMERNEGNLDILTTDYTSLQIGFSLFLTFTLSGLILSSIASYRFRKGDVRS